MKSNNSKRRRETREVMITMRDGRQEPRTYKTPEELDAIMKEQQVESDACTDATNHSKRRMTKTIQTFTEQHVSALAESLSGD